MHKFSKAIVHDSGKSIFKDQAAVRWEQPVKIRTTSSGEIKNENEYFQRI